jgi:ribosome biogenesis protein Nip4
LSWLAKSGAKSVVVDQKTAWLFICGRDIFRKGILTVKGSLSKNDYTIVLNEFHDCLGFGRVVNDFTAEGKGNDLTVKNVSDVGDFLRRENR